MLAAWVMSMLSYLLSAEPPLPSLPWRPPCNPLASTSSVMSGGANPYHNHSYNSQLSVARLPWECKTVVPRAEYSSVCAHVCMHNHVVSLGKKIPLAVQFTSPSLVSLDNQRLWYLPCLHTPGKFQKRSSGIILSLGLQLSAIRQMFSP